MAQHITRLTCVKSILVGKSVHLWNDEFHEKLYSRSVRMLLILCLDVLDRGLEDAARILLAGAGGSRNIDIQNLKTEFF